MSALTSFTSREAQTLDALLPGWRDLVGSVVWRIYAELDPEQPILTVKKWLLTYTFRIKDARPLLVLLFGEPTTP